MIALRLAGYPTFVDALERELRAVLAPGSETVRSLPDDAPAVAHLKDSDVVVTLPRLPPEAPWSIAMAGPGPRWVVVSPAPTFAEALSMAALGATDYVPWFESPARVARRIAVAAGVFPKPTAPYPAKLEELIELFDEELPRSSESWNGPLDRLAALLGVDHVGIVTVEAPNVSWRRDPGREDSIADLEWVSIPMESDTQGRLVFGCADETFLPDDERRVLARVAGLLLGQRLQRAQLASRILTAKREWEATVDTIRDPIVMLDPDNRVVRANRAFAALVKCRVQDVVGRPVSMLLGDTDYEDRWEPGKAVEVEGAAPISFKIDPDRWFRVYLLNLSYGPDGSIVYLRDVTEERRLISLLIQRERFAALGELADGVFHDLNNLATSLRPELACARGLVPALVAEATPLIRSGHLSERVREDLDVLDEALEAAYGATQRLGQVLNNLRQYSRLRQDTATGRSSHVPLDLNQLLQALPVLFSARGRQCGTEVRLELRAVQHVMGQPSELMRVFENLLKNALDATPSGGTILIVSSDEDGFVRVEVRDSGPGVPVEILSRIFDRGFTTRQSEGGTGLGLYISKQILREHEADLSVTSDPGMGATFVVRLPALRSERQEFDANDGSVLSKG